MRHLIYIGENEGCIGFCSHLPVREFYHTPDYRHAISLIDGIEGTPYIVVFFEYRHADKDIPRIKKIRERHPATYIVLITGGMDKEESLRYLRAGINNAIPHDTSPQSIEDIYRYLERRNEEIIRSKEKEEAIRKFVLPVWKRCFDVLFSAAAIVCLSPFLLITALAIRIESKGPVIYKSKRVGSNYKIFDFLKFRSMHTGADERLREFDRLNQYRADDGRKEPDNTGEEAGEETTVLVSDDFVIAERDYITRKSMEKKNSFVKLENDPRITKTGHILRKYSIDELPQLINILKGDMSVVGNRPLPLYEAELLTSDEYVDRFMAPAGLTGLWQVEKRGKAGRLSAEERKQLDIFYAKTFSFTLDIRIIFRTAVAFIQKEDA